MEHAGKFTRAGAFGHAGTFAFALAALLCTASGGRTQ